MPEHDETVDVDGLPRWIVDTVVVVAVFGVGFGIDIVTGTITATSYNFHTAEVLGMSITWSPGIAFEMVLFVGYFIGYRDILALEENNGA